MRRTLKAADLFCGAGGTSTGLIEACEELGYKVELTAINHWDIAVATHTANHPDTRHYCARIDSLKPCELFKENELDILWASPECTHHSIARGGKPINDQSRATAWDVVQWVTVLRPKILLVENVKEFLTWGPVTGGKKQKEKLGQTFLAWRSAIQSLGYTFDHRILCAADHGDPTTRRRLIIQAVRGRRKITWPEPTHQSAAEETDLFGGKRQPWKTARNDVIDWSISGSSIYSRKKPLAEKTMRRIMIGLEKFGLAPFTIHMEHQGSVRNVNQPLPTVTTARGGAMAVAEPYLVKFRGTNNAASVDEPSPAVTASGQHLGLAEPYLIQTNHGNGKDKKADGRRTRAVNQPLPTVAGNRGEWALCKPFIVGVGGPSGKAKAHGVDKPMPTVLAQNHSALCEPFLIGQQSGASPRKVSDPVPTVSTAGAISLVEPYLVQFYGNSESGQTINAPLGTVTTKDRFGLCQPMVEIDGERYLVDILFRMLKPKELALAQGFPADYKFTGNISQVVKQIGNAVPKNLAKAIVKAVLTAI